MAHTRAADTIPVQLRVANTHGRRTPPQGMRSLLISPVSDRAGKAAPRSRESNTTRRRRTSSAKSATGASSFQAISTLARNRHVQTGTWHPLICSMANQVRLPTNDNLVVFLLPTWYSTVVSLGLYLYGFISTALSRRLYLYDFISTICSVLFNPQ